MRPEDSILLQHITVELQARLQQKYGVSSLQELLNISEHLSTRRKLLKI